MTINLRPCPYRLVDGEGHILCNQIKRGDREVTPAICRACPIAQIDCRHLKATLDQQTRVPITVRWGNGKTQVWDDPTPPLAMQRAACSAKTIPILSPRDCAGCAIRQALVMPEAIPVMPTIVQRKPAPSVRRTLQPVPISSTAPAPLAQPDSAMATPVAEARTNIVAQKIIQLQEWLTKQKHPKVEDEEPEAVMPIAVGTRPSASFRISARDEERRVGWTD